MANKSSIIWTALAMALWQVVMGSVVRSTIANSPDAPEPFLWGWVIVGRQDILIAAWMLLYITIAYMGQDFIFSALSRTSKEVREYLDKRTTKADIADGTVGEVKPLKPTE